MNSQSSTHRNTPEFVIVQGGDRWYVDDSAGINYAWFSTEAEAIEGARQLTSRHQSMRLASSSY